MVEWRRTTSDWQWLCCLSWFYHCSRYIVGTSFSSSEKSSKMKDRFLGVIGIPAIAHKCSPVKLPNIPNLFSLSKSFNFKPRLWDSRLISFRGDMSKVGQEELPNLGVILEENRHNHHPSPLRDDEALSPQTTRCSLMQGQLSGHLGYVFLGESGILVLNGVWRAWF